MTGFDSDTLFGRKYRVIVGTGNGSGIDVSDLRCTFTIEKSMAETPNYSEVSIYNLSAQTENTLIQQGQRIVIEAGYDGNQYGLIFDGDIVQPLRDKEDSTTYKLTLISQDGDIYLNQGVVNESYEAGQTPRDILNRVTSNATETIEVGNVSENLENKKLARGKVVFGLARDYLRTIAKTEKAAFYVNDRKVEIVKAADLPKGKIIDLSGKTGLIGVPEQSEDGVKGKCLLNPFLNLNSFIHIDNSSIREEKIKRDGQIKQLDQDGIYRIIKLVHTGDTRGDTWYTEFTAVSQAGDTPSTQESMR